MKSPKNAKKQNSDNERQKLVNSFSVMNLKKFLLNTNDEKVGDTKRRRTYLFECFEFFLFIKRNERNISPERDTKIANNE